MGHALNNTLQDILCRYQRMNGKDVLWQPGTDHAGIATQMVVERQLMERQEADRRTLGREAFLERVWEWKAESGGAIVNQLKRLGASCDWSRERFTLDEGLSKAVAKVFVQLHREGLIYKDKRLVNWDPKFQTAISDLEVVQVECRGSFKWSRADGAPLDEAALAKALAKNPERPSLLFRLSGRRRRRRGDRRIHHRRDDAARDHARRHRGRRASRRPALSAPDRRQVRLPLVGRLIPIVADDYSDPEKGTGAVKITPAHDFNDFEVGRRHEAEGARRSMCSTRKLASALKGNLEFFDGLEARDHELARLIAALDGLDRFEARKRIVGLMAAEGRLEKIEPHAHTVPHGDRSDAVIEPWLTDQWYVDAKTLAQPALAAVREGKNRLRPEELGEDLFRLAGEHPALVHLAPALVGPPDSGLVRAVGRGLRRGERGGRLRRRAGRRRRARHIDARRSGKARRRTGALRAMFERDADVLDTWFSSALWPFSTLGWPEETPELKRFYPTNVLVTGFDIIFFWVARMMMMGLHFKRRGPVPRRLHPRPRPRREGREDVEVEGQRHRSARHSSTASAPTRCASPWPRWRRRGATSSSRRAASRATATSPPSCGTPRASPR